MSPFLTRKGSGYLAVSEDVSGVAFAVGIQFLNEGIEIGIDSSERALKSFDRFLKSHNIYLIDMSYARLRTGTKIIT